MHLKTMVLAAAVMIALVGNTLYMFLVDWFGLHAGWRALIAKLADRHATAVQQLFLPACHSAIQIPCKEWQ